MAFYEEVNEELERTRPTRMYLPAGKATVRIEWPCDIDTDGHVVDDRVDGKKVVYLRIHGAITYQAQAWALWHEIMHLSTVPTVKQVDRWDGLEELVVETISKHSIDIWKANPNVFLWIHEALLTRS
jgi:hypothetical protein